MSDHHDEDPEAVIGLIDYDETCVDCGKLAK